MSDLVGNHIVGFPTRGLKCNRYGSIILFVLSVLYFCVFVVLVIYCIDCIGVFNECTFSENLKCLLLTDKFTTKYTHSHDIAQT